jgi:hypothetical protein
VHVPGAVGLGQLVGLEPVCAGEVDGGHFGAGPLDGDLVLELLTLQLDLAKLDRGQLA